MVQEHHGAPLLNCSGLVLVRQLIERLGVASAIDAGVRVLRRCKWYRESDHILTLIFSMFSGGNKLQDVNRDAEQFRGYRAGSATMANAELPGDRRSALPYDRQRVVRDPRSAMCCIGVREGYRHTSYGTKEVLPGTIERVSAARRRQRTTAKRW